MGKGWNNKRGRAERGLGDTLVCDYRGRAVAFCSGEPSGLSVTLPKALAELTQVTGTTKIMVGFDRGGAYPGVFTACRPDASLSEFPCKQRMTDNLILSQRKPPWEEDGQSVQGHCPARRSRPRLASSLT